MQDTRLLTILGRSQSACRTFKGCINLHKHFKHVSEAIGTNPNSAILNFDYSLISTLLDRELNSSTPIRKLAGVVKQIGNDLDKTRMVGDKRNRNGGSVKVSFRSLLSTLGRIALPRAE